MTAAARLKEMIREVPDFPKQGISFKDLTTLLNDRNGLREAVIAMAAPYAREAIDQVVAIESRGFILGAPLAVHLGCGFVPVRKPGKLPAATLKQEYALEYGTDAVEIHQDGIGRGQRVLLVDDLLATGGTMEATCQLVERLEAEIVGLSFLVELLFLKGRERLRDYRIETVIQY
jgi:adenine phosphoribosyltransferase